MRATYSATEFEYDTVLQSEFRNQYQKFCAGHGLAEETVRQPQIVALGHPTAAGSIVYLRYFAYCNAGAF